jgi:hypothetical protein
MFDFITQTVLLTLGALIKKMFGKPLSSSGTSEMWIGLIVIVAGILFGVAAAQYAPYATFLQPYIF